MNLILVASTSRQYANRASAGLSSSKPAFGVPFTISVLAVHSTWLSGEFSLLCGALHGCEFVRSLKCCQLQGGTTFFRCYMYCLDLAPYHPESK